jgi:branched-chain amino acid transport system ATP-binding protein
MSNPKLILFDEISLGLAPIIVRDIYTTLPKIIDEGIAAMLVEQDLSKALEVSSRVYCLQEGKISLSGNVGDVSRDEITNAYFGINK